MRGPSLSVELEKISSGLDHVGRQVQSWAAGIYNVSGQATYKFKALCLGDCRRSGLPAAQGIDPANAGGRLEMAEVVAFTGPYRQGSQSSP